MEKCKESSELELENGGERKRDEWIEKLRRGLEEGEDFPPVI